MLTCLLCGQDTPCFAQSSVVYLSGVLREAVILPFGSWRLNYELLASVACPRDSSLSPITLTLVSIRPLFKTSCFEYQMLYNSLYLYSEYQTFKKTV